MLEFEQQSLSKRNQWLLQGDKKILAESRFDAFRAGGPGGQKQNKTSSAIRLTHLPSGITVTAIESRSRKENVSKAISRLKIKIALEIREPFGGKKFFNPHIALSNKQYPACVAEVLDALDNCGFRISETAQKLDTSSAQLVKFLKRNPTFWQKVNETREKLGLAKLT